MSASYIPTLQNCQLYLKGKEAYNLFSAIRRDDVETAMGLLKDKNIYSLFLADQTTDQRKYFSYDVTVIANETLNFGPVEDGSEQNLLLLMLLPSGQFVFTSMESLFTFTRVDAKYWYVLPMLDFEAMYFSHDDIAEDEKNEDGDFTEDNIEESIERLDDRIAEIDETLANIVLRVIKIENHLGIVGK